MDSTGWVKTWKKKKKKGYKVFVAMVLVEYGSRGIRCLPDWFKFLCLLPQ